MNNLFDKLNLRPQERRLVVVAAIAVFIVLNYMFVWSHFGKLNFWQNKKAYSQKTLREMTLEIGKQPGYLSELAQLKESGGYVPPFEASTVLRSTVERQASVSNVRLGTRRPRDTQSASNSFFEEKGLFVTYEARENELVDFLFNLGTNESLIRVSEITVGPDTRQGSELAGRITLVGSFQKTPRPSTATPPATASPRPSTPSTASPPPSPTSAATPTPMPTAPTPTTPPKTKTTPGIPPKTKSSPTPADKQKSTAKMKSEPSAPPPNMNAPDPMPKTKSSPTPVPTQINPAGATSNNVVIPRRPVPGSSPAKPN